MRKANRKTFSTNIIRQQPRHPVMKRQASRKRQAHKPRLLMNRNMRLQKYIASCTSYSRRKAEMLIEQGRVTVNGKPIKKQGVTINPEKDRIQLDGKPLEQKHTTRYIMLNKPAGYVSTKHDPHAEKTVMDLIPYSNLYPVGRLDKDTEGLLLLTNDGDFTYQVTHPKFEHEKEYKVILRHPLSQEDIRTLEQGITLEDGKTAPCTIRSLKNNNKASYTITIHEGKNRQIRRMFEEIQNHVIYLQRIRIGTLLLGDLKKGAYKQLHPKDAQRALKTHQ
ncbi:pseudouridine synthase [Candidatus Peregrinibacteria bacterium]|nr:pseudouridine synthase [Candidatus Peregrinibacteria bacterium]